jgi:hypothetical protein
MPEGGRARQRGAAHRPDGHGRQRVGLRSQTTSSDDKTLSFYKTTQTIHRHWMAKLSNRDTIVIACTVGDVVLHRATKQATAMQGKSLQAAAKLCRCHDIVATCTVHQCCPLLRLCLVFT